MDGFLDRAEGGEYDEPSDDEIQGCACCGYDPDACGCGRYRDPLDDHFWAGGNREGKD